MTEQKMLLVFMEHILSTCDGETIDISLFSEQYAELAQALNDVSQYINDAYTFALDISNGNLDSDAPPRLNMLSGPFRGLRSSLSHLTWQSQRVAAGDYNQHVDFMGEFSNSFNSMINQLKNREEELKKSVQKEINHAKELESYNDLLISMTQFVNDWIIMISQNSSTPSFLNSAAKYGLKDYELDINEICSRLLNCRRTGDGRFPSTIMMDRPNHPGEIIEFSVNQYSIKNKGSIESIYILRDTTLEQQKLREMEVLIYKDPTTQLYNRRYCLSVLDNLVRKESSFSLCFIDLNNLKVVNDTYGHECGDEYILAVANALRISLRRSDTICRFGGDEIVAILYNCPYENAIANMETAQNLIMDFGQKQGWNTSISYGVIDSIHARGLTSSEIIRDADAKMYEFKIQYKKPHH